VSGPFTVDVSGLEVAGVYSIEATGPSGAEKVLVIFGWNFQNFTPAIPFYQGFQGHLTGQMSSRYQSSPLCIQ
jgi:hypothetical protein